MGRDENGCLILIPTLKLFGNKCYFRFLDNILNTSLPGSGASQENLRFTWRPCPLRGCQRGHIRVKRLKDKGGTYKQKPCEHGDEGLEGHTVFGGQ